MRELTRHETQQEVKDDDGEVKDSSLLEGLLPFCRVLQSLPGTLELGYHLKQTKYGKYFSLSIYNL